MNPLILLPIAVFLSIFFILECKRDDQENSISKLIKSSSLDPLVQEFESAKIARFNRINDLTFDKFENAFLTYVKRGESYFYVDLSCPPRQHHKQAVSRLQKKYGNFVFSYREGEYGESFQWKVFSMES